MKRTAPAVTKAQKGKRKKTFKTAEHNEEAFKLPAPEVPDEQLFVVDKKGDTARKMTTEMWRAKPLKADVLLAAMTGKTGLEPPKKHKPKRSREIVPNPPAQRPAKAAVGDLWAESEAPKPPRSPWEEYWIPSTQKEREALQSQRRVSKPLYAPPASSTAHKALVDPRSLSNGLSYHPDRESHQDALGEAAAHEVRLLQEAERLKKTLHVRSDLPDDSRADEETLAQMVQFVRGGMRPLTEAGEEREEEEEDEDERQKGAPKSKKGKKRRVDAVRKRSLKLKRKARLGKQIEQLGLILREVDKEGEQRAREDLAKAEQRKLRRGETRRIGRNKFEPLRPAVLLESDLPSSLRAMGNDKPLQGNRVAEAFESLQRRNMVPVTKRMPKHKRHPVKRFERPADKQSWARLEQHKFGELL